MSANAQLLWMLLVHLVLTGLPAVLAALLAMRRGICRVEALLAVALAASGATAMLAFWAYFLDPLAGQVASFVIALGSVQGIFLCRGDLDRALLRQLAVPLALWALGSGFVLYLGFLHGGTDQPLAMATTRFSHPLPSDNEIPRYFADWFYRHGHDGTPPPFVDWLSSDRPPLQTGYVLAQRPFGWDSSGLQYQVLAVVLQQLWVVGMWAVLCAARLRPLPRGLVMLATMVSDVAIVHGFFVWPKLLAAAFVLAALALVISPEWDRWRRDLRVAGLFAALCGLAMLAHGGSAFAIVPLLLLAAVRGLPSWRWIGIAALVGVVVLAPWSAYQRYFDPPGNRLVKWQIGGFNGLDERGAMETIVDSYREAGFNEALQNKWANVTRMVGQEETESSVSAAVDDLEAGHPGEAIATLRLPRFFDLLPFLGILLIGPIAILVARARGRPDGPEWRFALTGLWFCLLVAGVWSLLMFGTAESSAMIHQGTLLLPLLAVCVCVAGAYCCDHRLAVGLVAANVLVVLALYVPALTPLPGTSYSPLAAILAALTLAGFGLVAFRREPA
jgi:hypothetical protein